MIGYLICAARCTGCIIIQKIVGDQLQVDIVKNLKLPQWFRVVTVWIKLVGVAGLLIGFWLAITILVGMITHIRVKDSFGKSTPAFALLVIPSY